MAIASGSRCKERNPWSTPPRRSVCGLRQPSRARPSSKKALVMAFRARSLRCKTSLPDRPPSQEGNASSDILAHAILHLSHMIAHTERRGSYPCYLVFNLPFQARHKRNATRDCFLEMHCSARCGATFI